MKQLFFLILCVLASCQSRPPIIPGTSLELAKERKATLRNVTYDLFFDIPESAKDSIPVREVVTFELEKPVQVQLDFSPPASHLKTISINGKSTNLHYEQEHLILDESHLQPGINKVEISLMAGDGALNRHEDYLYTLFVPARATTCFPVFDQPDIKAIWNLSLTIPASWVAVSQGSATTSSGDHGRKTMKFSATKPTSTYQFAFAAGKFRHANDTASGMNIYYRETDSLKVSRNLPKIFQLHRESLAWLENYTGIKYPYEKFDFALMPAFQFGGMEHPGNIFYRESALFLDPSASVNEELRRAGLIAHETAHMWFGNLVTMEWFNDVWLKEVFANFMAGKIVNPGFPEINHELRFLMGHYPGAYDVDRTEGTHPIQQPLANLKRAGSVYGAIIYQKAPIMMRNLENIMGENDFRTGLKEYLRAFSYSNATWDDLVATLSKHTGKNLSVWNESWIKQAGRPTLVMHGHTLVVENGDEKKVWPQTLTYQIVNNQNDTGGDSQTFDINGKAELQVPDTTSYIIPNSDGRGYGYFKVGQRHREFMLNQVPQTTEAVSRAAIWMNAWEYMLNGELGPEELLERLLVALKSERDPLLFEYTTDKAVRIFWQFIPSEQRHLSGVKAADDLLALLKIEKDPSLKRSLFQAFREVALKADHLDLLAKYLQEKQAEGLPLAERDQIQIAFALSLRGRENEVHELLPVISNPDRKKEIEFILPALAGDEKTRDGFFEKLRLRENRTQEPWVLTALHYLHHPLRSSQSKKYVPESLAMLEEIQQTGDIFFPSGWLEATLGQYQSAEVTDDVRKYLQTNTSLPPDLKNKLLQSADMLFRASRVTSGNKSY